MAQRGGPLRYCIKLHPGYWRAASHWRLIAWGTLPGAERGYQRLAGTVADPANWWATDTLGRVNAHRLNNSRVLYRPIARFTGILAHTVWRLPGIRRGLIGGTRVEQPLMRKRQSPSRSLRAHGLRNVTLLVPDGTVNLSGRVSRVQATGSGDRGSLPTQATDFGPDPEVLGSRSSMLGGSGVIAAKVEEVIDLIVS